MRKILMTLAAVLCCAMTMAVLTFSSCGQSLQSSEKESEADMFDSLRQVAWDSRNLSLLPVIDSLQNAGLLSASRADYLRGVTYDLSRHTKVGESYYKKLYEIVDPKKEGWPFYLEIASRLSLIRMTTSNYKGAIDVATKTLERAEKAGELTDQNKISFLWSIALCQNNLEMSEGEQTAMKVYDLLEKKVKDRGLKVSHDLFLFSHVITQTYLYQERYEEATKWQDRSEDMLKLLDQPSDSLLVKEYTWILALTRIELLEQQGKVEQAQILFEKTFPLLMDSPEGMTSAADYLLDHQRYAEAADIYNRIDAILPADNKNAELNLENIGITIIPRLFANIEAGRKDSVMAIARYLAEHYNQALKDDRKNNAAELATIYETQQKDAEIAQQQISLSRQRWMGTLVALVLLTTFFIIYTWYRRRAEKRLGEAHGELQNAYNQLEETTAAKERIESELRIARDIQMSMVPGIFPEREGLDMYAEMTPAKEVGGDLYGYVLQGDVLYFCVGDVSGKGVPASLFMAQSARLFRTFAAEGMMPADIAVRMNNELAEGNDSNMFVTMFIGMLHLDTGCLDFCNCGHNAPVFDGQFLEMKYVNQMMGYLEGATFYGEAIDDIRGHRLLVYTDGLNEAENQQKELLGNDRLLELMSGAATLDSHQVIDMLKEAVERHRAGAEPNDDLTLMCISLKNE